MGKIRVREGKFDETCTTSSNLTDNAMKQPAIREVMEYAEPRMLSTMIVSGAKSPWDLQAGSNAVKTKIGEIPKDKLIGDNAYRYNVTPRIQQKSVINSQIGVSGADGTFTLSMKDNYLVQGMVAIFHTNQLQARVMAMPTGSPGNYIYNFQTVDGTAFNFATHVTPQPGAEKTCFGSYTAYGERSLRGFSRSHYPDMFINHLTIQRKTVAISGSALTDVTWYYYNDIKGWRFTKERQAKLTFMMEDEFHKWFSRSTMKDSSGNLLNASRIIDSETGEQVVIGDAVIPQIEGGNEIFGSGVDGQPTIDDYTDLMKTLEKKSNSVYGKIWYVVTGTDGYANAQSVLRDYWVNNMGGHSAVGTQTMKVGGEDIVVGGNFDTFNVNGNQLIFVKHTLFDDEERFTERASDGGLIQSSMCVVLDMGVQQSGKKNMEILTKGAYGVNRSMVDAYLNGLTGSKVGTPVSSVDALEYNMLKEDGIFIYNTQSCGLIRRAA